MPDEHGTRHDIEFTVNRRVRIFPNVRIAVQGVEYVVTSVRNQERAKRVTGRRAAFVHGHTPTATDYTHSAQDINIREPQTFADQARQFWRQFCECGHSWPLVWRRPGEPTSASCRRCGQAIRPASEAVDGEGNVLDRQYDFQEAGRETRRELLRRANELRENIPDAVANVLDTAAAYEASRNITFGSSGARIVDWAETQQPHAFDVQGYINAMQRGMATHHDFLRCELAEHYHVADWEQRTLEPSERRFMLRHCGRMEAELRWLVENNPTVRDAWADAKRGGLSETSAAELAVIALARENEDLRRQLQRTRLVSVLAEE